MLGAHWRIGDTLLEVSAPRVPCATFQHWSGAAQWVKRFTLRSDTGCYFRVLEEGAIGAGDPVEVVYEPAHGITVRDVFTGADMDRLTRLPDVEPTVSDDIRKQIARHARRHGGHHDRSRPMSVELVEVVRSGFRECVHRGSLVVLGADGEPTHQLGEVHLPIYPRSTNKPMQAITLLRNGFEPVDDAELAIVTASHYGESDHVALVRRLLERFGFTEHDLACPPDLPFEERARAAAIRADGARRIYMNCSGKHAAMLATCAVNGWPTEGYLDEGHPLQKAVISTVTEITGEPETDLGIDGCGLPIIPVSLVNLARAFATMATAEPGSPPRRVADAIRAHPRVISGTDAPDLLTMSATPGLVCKIGADGVHAGALPDGRAFAYKIDDGHDRARMPLTLAILHAMGVDWTDVHTELAAPPVLGGGARVGVIRAIPGIL